MKILAWDCSSFSGSFAAVQFENNLFENLSEWNLNIKAQHSDRLLWSIHQTLEAVSWKLNDIDLFAVGVGPGSFTSLRISVATATTLASSIKRPLIGINSLDAMNVALCEQFDDQKFQDTWSLILNSAVKGEAYYRSSWLQSTDSSMGSAESAWIGAQMKRQWAQEKEPSQLIISGTAQEEMDGILLQLNELKNIRIIRGKVTAPRASHVAEMAVQRWKANPACGLPTEVLPQYFRKSSAEMKRERTLT